MARKPSIRAKNGYWYSEAGGQPRYYGRCDTTTLEEATAALWAMIAGHATPPSTRQRHDRLDVAGLKARFLAWVGKNRAEKNLVERTRHLKRFVDFAGAETVAESVDTATIERFVDWMAREGYSLDYRAKHLTSVKAMYRRGVRMGWIRPCDPFARFEPLHLPPKTLGEADLPTPVEVRALIAAGDACDHMGDLLRLYHATGARTHELIRAKVGDFDRRTSAIVLADHKTARKTGVVRTINLSAEAVAVLERHAAGRPPEEPIFRRPVGRDDRPTPYSSVNVAERFQTVRGRAGVRSSITIYSFRHLWISECLMAGLDSLLVARMAGTSVKMIETVYGRFRVQTFQDAQSRLDALRAGRRG